MKIILNKCYGGFDVSDAAYRLYAKKKGVNLYNYNNDIKLDTYVKGKSRFGDSDCYFTKDYGPKVHKKDIDWAHDFLYLNSRNRTDPVLIEVIEELGENASGPCGRLVVVDIPDDMDWVIDNFDGIETLRANVPVW